MTASFLVFFVFPLLTSLFQLQEMWMEICHATRNRWALSAMMRDFLAGHQRREEVFLAELKRTEAAVSAYDWQPCGPQAQGEPAHPPPGGDMATEGATLTTVPASSPRLVLPTPSRQWPHQGSGETSQQTQELSHRLDQPASEWKHYAVPKIPPYKAGEDIENYLLCFEQIAKTWKVLENEWAC